MPRYFFDFHNDGEESTDDEGSEWESQQDAIDEAVRALVEITRELLPGTLQKELALRVFDEARRPVATATIRFEVTT
ncbi:hypothetical protein NP945_30900 [Mesorhizobium sp. LMG17149]|uniref:DUF6894 family protein n=1 Tax=Mesorhizobium sp. LMG17149 TaxID=2968497 RepID=UPI000FEAB10A|nr:hypothetical protein [Mesorhizobium sp. LMG17149]MCQ8876256.1 hypothetical protein [Mesorhizobium sp. LMG17149]RWO37494.1 MAG: hypothetical protein EOS12_32220 [Mesorhizobium sp.]